MHKALAMHAIDISEFAVVVISRPAFHVKSLLSNPLPYPSLAEDVKADYWNMVKWLQKTLQGNYFYNLSRIKLQHPTVLDFSRILLELVRARMYF